MPYSPYYLGGFKDLPDQSTPLIADFFNDLESALTGVFTIAEAAIPNPSGRVTNEVLLWNGSAWVSEQIPNASILDGTITRTKLSNVFPIVNADVDPAAAIARSKLNFGSGLVNSDIAAAAAIAYSKLSLGGSILNADINSSAAIARSKLDFGAGLVNADISSVAAIAVAKLAAGSDTFKLKTVSSTPTWVKDNKLQTNTTMADTPEVTTESDLQSLTIAAGELAVGDMVRITASGNTTGSAGAKTLRLKFGATTIVTKVLVAGTGNWIVEAHVIVTGASTQIGHGIVFSATTVEIDMVNPAETIANAITVKTTGQTASAADEIESHALAIQVIRP